VDVIFNIYFMKKCSICKEIKETSEFPKDTRMKDGFSSNCKFCKKEISKKYREKNKDKIKKRNQEYNNNNKDYFKKYREDNKEDLKEYKNKYKEDNKENIKEYNKQYRKNNEEDLKEYQNRYRELNKEKIKDLNKRYYKKTGKYKKYERKDYQKNYQKNRKENDFLFRLSNNIRSLISSSLKKKGYTKDSKLNEILGCSFEEFKLYLESQFENWMSWDNYGLYNGELNYGFDIDHIKPLSSAKTKAELILLNHYTNLQPLCSKINRDIKKANYNWPL